MKANFTKNKKINISIFISILALICSFLTQFLFTKFLLKQPQIGDLNYGLKVTAASVVNFVSIFTTGMSSTFIRFHKKYKNNEKSVISTFNLITLIISIAALIFGLIMFILAINNKIIDPKGGVYTQKQVTQFAIILAISVVYLSLSIIVSPSKWFLESCKHIILVRLVDLIVVILYPVISIGFVVAGGDMIVVTIIYSVVYLAGFLFLFGYRIKKERSLNFLKINVNKSLLKEILVFSLFVVVTSAIASFSFSFDKFMLTVMLTAELTTIYQLGITFHQVMLSIVSLIYSPYAPYLAEDIANNNNDSVQSIYDKVTLILMIISFLLFVGFAACGKEFVLLWVGSKKELVYYFALVLFGCWPLYSMVMFSTSIQRLYGKHYKSSIFYVISFAIHVILTCSLIKIINIWACIIGISASYMFLGITFIIYNKKAININQKHYLINMLKLLICSGASFGLTYLISMSIKSHVTLNTTILFLIKGSLVSIFFVIILTVLYWSKVNLIIKKLTSK